MAILEIKDLQVKYGVIPALKGLSFHVDEGEVVALIGANGAGKTTTLHAISSIVPKAGGTITFDGKDITEAVENGGGNPGGGDNPGGEEGTIKWSGLSDWTVSQDKNTISL